MKKGKMPTFIQAMYGTVLGLAFYKISIPTADKLSLAPIHKMEAFWSGEETFQFVLFLFTLLIVAHDWFSYHTMNSQSDSYWGHIPQIFSLFFLSQMFVAIESVRLQYWFLFAFWYTISNILYYGIHNKFKFFEREKKYSAAVKYGLHLILTFIFFIITDNRYKPVFWCYLVLTFCIVVGLWIIDYREKNKEK